MEQEVFTAVNNLDRPVLQDVLETQYGMAVYDDEPMQDLREALLEQLESNVDEQQYILCL